MARRKKRKGRIISNGIKKIISYLEQNQVSFVLEHKIPECKNIRTLPFDVAVFKGPVLLFLIEYNGQHHYKPVRKFGGRKALQRQQKHDLIKVDFCETVMIPLLIISFEDEEKIPDILGNFLKNNPYK